MMVRPLASLICLLCACSPLGGGAYSELETYDAPGGEYRVRYLSPPWLLTDNEGSTAEWIVESNGAALVAPSTIVTPKYELLVTVHSGRAASLIESDFATAQADGETVLVAIRSVTTDFNDSGVEFITELPADESRYRRYVYLDRETSGSVRMLFEAYPLLDEAEVDRMIGAVELDPTVVAE
jgi:hypothetical protein